MNLVLKLVLLILLLGAVWKMFQWLATSLGGMWGIENKDTAAGLGTLIVVGCFFILYRWGTQAFLLFATVVVSIFFLLKHYDFRASQPSGSMPDRERAKTTDPILVFYMLGMAGVAFWLYSWFSDTLNSDWLAYVCACISFVLLLCPIVISYYANSTMQRGWTITAYGLMAFAIAYQVYLVI